MHQRVHREIRSALQGECLALRSQEQSMCLKKQHHSYSSLKGRDYNDMCQRNCRRALCSPPNAPEWCKPTANLLATKLFLSLDETPLFLKLTSGISVAWLRNHPRALNAKTTTVIQAVSPATPARVDSRLSCPHHVLRPSSPNVPQRSATDTAIGCLNMERKAHSTMEPCRAQHMEEQPTGRWHSYHRTAPRCK